MFEIFKECIKKILKDKKTVMIVIMLFSGILFTLLPIKDKNEIDDSDSEISIYNNLSSATEEKLKKLILSIDGVENAEIMVCFSDMGIKEYYKDETEDTNDGQSRTDKKIVLKRYEGNEVPVLKREVYPEVKGVTVIADCTKKSLYDVIFKAVRASLGADPHKIEIIINDRSKK